MIFPTFKGANKGRNVQLEFGGLNYRESCGEAEFTVQRGISSSEYPLLIADNSDYEYDAGVPLVPISGSTKKDDKLIYWGYNDNGKIEISVGGVKHLVSGFFSTLPINVLDDWKMTRVSMGRYIFCQSSEIVAYIDLADYSSGIFGERIIIDGSEGSHFAGGYFEPCLPGGGVITTHPESYYTSNKPTDGDYKAADGGGLYQWNSSYGTWVAIANTDVRIQTQGALDVHDFHEGDGVRITVEGLNWSNWPEGKNIFINQGTGDARYIDTVIKLVNEDEIQFSGQISKRFALPQGMKLTIERRCPDIRYITECSNRLCACSADGHEIYCSKLGDFKNWYCFEGISTDSWASTVGSDGLFTGATTYNNNVYFFKKDSIVKIAPSNSGAHVAIETRNKGTINNDSIQVINSVMYYLASDSICAYEGSTPYSVSEKLGGMYNLGTNSQLLSAMTCSVVDRYYILVEPMLYSFDTKRGLWNVERDFHTDTRKILFRSIIGIDDQFLGIGNVSTRDGGTWLESLNETFVKLNDREIRGLGLTSPTWDHEVAKWEAVTGQIGYQTPDHKYVSKVNVFVRPMERGSEMAVNLIYEDSGEKVRVGTIRPSVHGQRAFTFTIVPKRCNHFQVSLEGHGRVILYSIAKTIEEGSDVT